MNTVNNVIDLTLIRRSERLFRIILERFGLDYFFEVGLDAKPEPTRARVDEMVELACRWLTARTGRAVTVATRDCMEKRFCRALLKEHKSQVRWRTP
jgi:hypothetical protein